MSVPVTIQPDETFVLNVGPQHPATHGVLRVKMEMDGEYIVNAETVIGYIHRMHEKMAENQTTTAGEETLSFEAEVSRLLHLMVHSVYSNRDVFLRELISTAAAACERLRTLALSEPGLAPGEAPFRIVLSADKAAGTLTSDPGRAPRAGLLPCRAT